MGGGLTMGSYKDIIGTQQGWIHELARGELYPDADRVLNASTTFNPQTAVEESTIHFLSELRECFTKHSSVFNAFSEEGTKFQAIKIYNLATSAADFMLYRNQMKLVVTNSAHGVIQLLFSQHIHSSLSINGSSNPSALPGGAQSQAFLQPQDLLAQVGPFRDVYWTFQGERVTADQVTKFYFAEFVRASRELKRSRGGFAGTRGSVESRAGAESNQVLLEQIKTLLQEKGLELK